MATEIGFHVTVCPSCSREILPKRYYVPIQPPAPPPSSPTSDSKNQDDAPAARLPRTKTGNPRRGGGLVHGTGRVKPNGAIKRSDTVKEAKKPSPPAPAADVEPSMTRPTGPVRHRTVIDQSPVPMYCSDECRLADLRAGQVGLDYNPERCVSPPMPPVPHNSYSDFSSPDESDSGASFGSQASLMSSCLGSDDTPIPSGYAALRKLYPELPAQPHRAPQLRPKTEEKHSSLEDYNSGIMMASRRITETLKPEPAKRTLYGTVEKQERKPIPGWTDGSQAWRASVYGFAPPQDFTKTRPTDESVTSAYKGFVASSHRSRGVYSTLSTAAVSLDSASASASALPTQPQPPRGMGTRSRSEAEELYSKYPLFAKRSDSRASLASARPTSPTGSTRSLPVCTAPRRKEFSLVKPGAEGRLLVPDVKMTRTPSNLTMSSETSSSYSSAGFYGGLGRRRSPLSRQNSDTSVETADSRTTEADATMHPMWPSSSLPSTQQVKPQTRSWSYADDRMTFPILQVPKMEKRIERRIVDGEERDVEVEVEVVEPLKRLFLFPAAR
ncbi:hypothetical protein WOLCODRAFT_136716 [Wolfiporia cocos MD-104 SS10]|uniref:Uncharacterized protein n=1 Tax=Wolfiporia cocos (strain MD-104) TaxID=742152 RepID=A0A2H3JE72_WOLCO|nr:hypothetical protein WOLCODRAFT_136716 [Wolfiporia cocos MD-104 SS10]